ncbi:MAG: hypothetical protein JO103_01350 [Candidatus Eremiobacteraeota bacterium]|nr:hypothetical protein [Candidatus Eremiobacteraeota bacterium]MBV9407920.1 hypothetical protein [Candidatus Eremiobacteraeota bacterium]
MLAAVLLALSSATFQPITAATTSQPAHVYVRDSSAPALTDAAAGGPHDAGLRFPADNDAPSAQLSNAHGGALHVSLAEWRAATGTADLTPTPDGGVRVHATFKGLMSAGRYSLFIRQLAGRNGVVLTPVDITGAADGFFADKDGNGDIAVQSPNPIPANAQLVLIYHSDGSDHLGSPGNLGVNAHEQLIARVP